MRILACVLCAVSVLSAADPRVYPQSPRIEHTDDYHGVKVADPYRWLEESDSKQVQAWVTAQNQLTFSYLGAIPPRAAIRKRMEQLFDDVRHRSYLGMYAGMASRNGRRFFLRQAGSQNQAALYVQDGTSAPRPLVDPNPLSSDGTVAVVSWDASPDGKWLAYGLSKAGSDWQEFRVREVDTGKDLPEVLEWIKFATPSWTADGTGFYYSRFPRPEAKAALTSANYNQKLYYHRINTSQEQDTLVYQRPDHKEWRFRGTATGDGRYLVVEVRQGTGRENLIFYKDLQDASSKVIELIGQFGPEYAFLDNEGSRFYFATTERAPRGRIITMDANHPGQANWKEIVPQKEWTLNQAVISGGVLVLNYLREASSYARLHRLDGSHLRDVTLPGVGTVLWARESRDATQFYSFMSFVSPELIYECDTKTGASKPLEPAKSPLEVPTYETRQVFYSSKDGVRVPMFLAHRRGLKLDGSNATLLYGYGGFNVSNSPAYRRLFAGWLDMGGLLAVANLRGGGEYGEEWHQAGTKLRKQNVFDDFIAAAEWLVKNKYTSTPKLAIHGGSNGGLLVGAVLNQRPELFGAAVPAVGVMDMLRFHKFTVGASWVSDYGSPDNPEEFQALYAYSPLHNIKRGTKYPPTLILTSDHDDRVVPAHSFKYAAAMQYAQEGPAPILIRIETSAGHGAGKPASKQIEEYSEVLAFLAKALAMEF